MPVFEILASLTLAAALLTFYHVGRNWRADRKFIRQVELQSHLFLSDNVLARALEEADKCGIGHLFREYVSGILLRTQLPKIKVGHLLWIFKQLEANIPFHRCEVIPEFDPPVNSNIHFG